ncbi:MAG: phosphotransferase [Chloroflexia bacterium]
MTLPVGHSVIAPDALLDEVARSYALPRPTECALFRSWANDVYLVTTAEASYYLKVYGFGWRTRDAVAYEIDLLAHLDARGVAVALPILRHDEEAIGSLDAPEGERCAVLFAAAPGEKPQPPFSTALYHQFGRATAQLHAAADDFSSLHARDRADLALFIDRPLSIILPSLRQRPGDQAYLRDLGTRVRDRLNTLIAARLDWGVCHGDLSLDNVHVTDDGRLIFYDFDSGGPGWRAADPYGVYQYAVMEQNGLWDAFLAGYTEIRQFGSADLAALPYFVVAQHLWDIGHTLGFSAGRFGFWRANDAYFDRKLAFLRQWEAEFIK